MRAPPTKRTGPERTELERLLRELGEGARDHRFRVAPNPCVGAAVLSDGVEIGRGFHREWGAPHAEEEALRAAERSGVPRARWDTLVVTLEPCSTEGKRPACVDAVLAAGISHVVVGAVDPNPEHRGSGLERLREAGVDVEVIDDVARLEHVSPHFLRWTAAERLRRPRPWAIAKWAQTLTGQLTPPEHIGEGRWISGPQALADVQCLRSRVDAIVTGVGTVLADDPRLTVRAPGDPARAPLRVVLDSELRTPPDARLFQATAADEGGGAVHVLCRAGAGPARHRALQAAGASVHSLPHDGRRLSLTAVADFAWQRGARRVLVEAGPTLLEALFDAHLLDQIEVYTGAVAGGRGPTLAARLDPATLTDVERREVGEDALLEAFL